MEVLRHLIDAKIVGVRPPDAPIVDVPAVSGVVHQDDPAEVIHEHPGVADLEGLAARVGVRSQRGDGRVKAAQVRGKRIAFPLAPVPLLLDAADVEVAELILRFHFRLLHGAVDLGTGRHGVADGDLAVGGIARHAIPLVAHQGAGTEDAVDLFLDAAAPESKICA